jgi:hypothetical protein
LPSIPTGCCLADGSTLIHALKKRRCLNVFNMLLQPFTNHYINLHNMI